MNITNNNNSKCHVFIIMLPMYGRNAKTPTYLQVSASQSSAMDICILLVFGFTLQTAFKKQILCVVHYKKNPISIENLHVDCPAQWYRMFKGGWTCGTGEKQHFNTRC